MHEAHAAAALTLTSVPEAAGEVGARAALVSWLSKTTRGADARLASELVALAAPAMLALDSVPALGTSPRATSAERLMREVRAQISSPPPDALLQALAGQAYAVVFFEAIRKSLLIMALEHATPSALLRGAVSRAATLASASASWLALEGYERRQVAQQCVWALAERMVSTAAVRLGELPQESVGLARVACKLVEVLPSVGDWLGESHLESDAAQAPRIPNRQSDGALSASTMASRPQNEQGKKMDSSNKSIANHPIVKNLQADAVEAAWRTAGSQFVKLTREPLVGVLSRHLGPDDPALRNKIAAFLQTEIGTAMLSGVLSVGLSAMPVSMGDAPHRLAKELRVKALADMGDLVAEVLMGPLRAVMAVYLQDVSGMVAAVTPELPSSNSDNVVPLSAREKEAAY